MKIKKEHVVGVQIPDAEIWKSVEAGKLTGFSIEGTGELIEEEQNEQTE